MRGFADPSGVSPRSSLGQKGLRAKIPSVEVVLRTRTPEGIDVVLPALVYAKILEEHAAVVDLALIDRTIREPTDRSSDPRPGRERFFRRDGDLWVLAVVDFGDVPAIIVTAFSAERPTV